MEVKGTFDNWLLTPNFAANVEKGYYLYTGMGFRHFSDFVPPDDKNFSTFLTGLSYWQRRKLWRELKRYRRSVAVKTVTNERQ